MDEQGNPILDKNGKQACRSIHNRMEQQGDVDLSAKKLGKSVQ